MKLSFALLASTLAVADASGSAGVHRQLSYQKVAGYSPASQVTDHCAIDLDQNAIAEQLVLKTPEGFEAARAIYNNGGHSKSYATVTLATPLTAAVSKGEPVLAKNAQGTEVTGKMYGDFAAGVQEIKVQYATSDDQANYVGCQVGSLVVTNDARCFAASGALAVGGKEYNYQYDPAAMNTNGRSIAGFSTGAGKKMRKCETCPYTDYQYFYDYYGREDYAHHWVESAFDKTNTDFTNGNADFSNASFDGMAEYIKKGTAYMNVFMYVIREYEDALDDCEKACIDCNDSAVHAWDEGVCFYTGSLEGKDGSGSGKLLYGLADKRCQNYKTCGESGTETDGTAKVNHDLYDLMDIGQFQLQQGECSKARATTKKIIKMMYIPLIQGSMRYAYKVSKLQGGEKEKAEGSVFSAAVLPRIHAASPEAAKTIYNNMKVGAATIDHAAVKEAFESTYLNLGITCEDVGGLYFAAENKYYEGMEPCDTATLSTRGNSGLRVGLSAVSSFGAAMVLYFSL